MKKYPRNDDAGSVLLGAGRSWESRLKETEKTARARTAIGFLSGYAQQKDEQLKDISVLERRNPGASAFALPEFLKEFRNPPVQRTREWCVGWPFIVDSGSQSAEGFPQRLDCRANRAIIEIPVLDLEIQKRCRKTGDDRPALVYEILPDRDITIGILFGGERLSMLRFPAVRGHQMRAVERTINRNLAFAATADGADLLAFRGTEALRRSLFADGTAHSSSDEEFRSGTVLAKRLRERVQGGKPGAV